jgi:hypothetical protein
MTKAEDYRTKADECTRLARMTQDPDVKAQIQNLAVQWRELAEWAGGKRPNERS